MTQQEFQYIPRFDWEREIARSRQRIAVRVAARLAMYAALIIGPWVLIWVAAVELIRHPPAIPLP